MTIQFAIRDGTGINGNAKVTVQKQLVVGPLAFSTPNSSLLGVAATPVELVPPKPMKFIVLTDLILTANRLIGVNDATVTLYESDVSGAAQGAGDRTVFTVEMIKSSNIVLTGLNWKVNTGKYLNAVTDDDDIFVNLACYYAEN